MNKPRTIQEVRAAFDTKMPSDKRIKELRDKLNSIMAEIAEYRTNIEFLEDIAELKNTFLN